MAVSTDAGRQPGEALPRRPWFQDRIDRLLLLLFFSGGFVLILAIKLAGRAILSLDGAPVEPRWLAAGVAALLLLLYAGIASRTRALRLHPERLGDNCYYLGLVYTLASLAAALIELERVTPEVRGALIESLLASFGIALISTILGIALRVWFVQMRREIDDLEAELQGDLQVTAQKLKDQLLFAVTELESFRLRTQQILHERLSQSTDLFTATAERQAKAIEELGQSVTGSIARVAAALGEPVEAFRRAAGETAAATGDLAARIRAVEVPRDVVAAPARRLKDSVERFAASVERLEGTGERFARGLDERLVGFGARLVELSGTVDQFVARLNSATGVASALEALARDVEPARARLVELGGTLAELLRSAREDAKEIRSLRDQIRSDLAEYHRLQRELGHGLGEIAETIVKRLEA